MSLGLTPNASQQPLASLVDGRSQVLGSLQRRAFPKPGAVCGQARPCWRDGTGSLAYGWGYEFVDEF